MIYDTHAGLYDRQYASYRDDVPFYLRAADDIGSPVLELGAGTGRVTEALARAGHSVVAVDASAAMLERAAVRLATAGVSAAVELVHGDMRSMRFDQRFPLVIAPFNALMHLYTIADQDAALRGVSEHLADGGVFAFDLYVPRFGPMGVLRSEPYWADLHGADRPGFDLHGAASPDVGGAPSDEPGAHRSAARTDLFLVQQHDELAQLVTSTYYHDTTEPDGSVRRTVASLTQRYYTRFELERALALAGMRVEVYGDFARSRFDAESRLMVGLARRRDAPSAVRP